MLSPCVRIIINHSTLNRQKWAFCAEIEGVKRAAVDRLIANRFQCLYRVAVEFRVQVCKWRATIQLDLQSLGHYHVQ